MLLHTALDLRYAYIFDVDEGFCKWYAFFDGQSELNFELGGKADKSSNERGCAKNFYAKTNEASRKNCRFWTTFVCGFHLALYWGGGGGGGVR